MRTALAASVGAVLVAGYVGFYGFALPSGTSAGDPWEGLAGPGRPLVRLATLRLPSGQYEFRGYAYEDGTPGIAYVGAGWAGSRRLVAVGPRGGWALEPRVMRAGDRDVVFGAAIPETVTVAARTDAGETRAATFAVPGLGFRWFVFATEPGSRVAGANDVVALDGDGRLLGRPHNNVSTYGPPDAGPYDGLWDRSFSPGPAR